MNVGSRTLLVPDLGRGCVRTWVLHPTEVTSSPSPVGPYLLDVAPEAAPSCAETSRTVVLVSHGSGGSPYTHRLLAHRLAREGYVVALPAHPGNTLGDDTHAQDEDLLVRRARHLQRVLDALLADPALGASLAPHRVAIVGHSMGAATALALAGAIPYTRAGEPLAPVHDPRVGCLVLLAPTTPFYLPEGSLARVTVPVLVLAGEEDRITPPWNARLVADRVPDGSRVTLRLVPRAGHFSFLSPFPAERRGPSVPPSMDPEGFDREAYQTVLGDDVVAFFGQTLARGSLSSCDDSAHGSVSA